MSLTLARAPALKAGMWLLPEHPMQIEKNPQSVTGQYLAGKGKNSAAGAETVS